MKLLINLFSIIFQLFNAALAAEDFTRTELGQPSAVNHYPWLASIQQSNRHHCAGSIISENIVLSAASCFGKYLPRNFTVRVGSSKAHIGGSVHNVINVKKHESLNRNGSDSDLALLKVSPPFVFNANVSSVSLASKEYDIEPGTNVSVAGWGFYEELNDVKMHTQQCNPQISGGGHICASSKEICLGDAGSPLFANGVLIGVMHRNSRCISRDKRQRVFSDVSHFLDWIVLKAGALQPFSYEIGEISAIQRQPWLASIQWENEFWCTGIIVSQSVVLSSAFCFARYPTNNLTVRVGSSEVDFGGTVHQVDVVRKHAKFSYNNVSGSLNDVALLKVSPPFVFSDNVSPVKLAGTGYSVESDTDVNVVGWSRTGYQKTLELRDTRLRIVKCSRKVSEGHICAGLSTLKRIKCAFDSGEPLLKNDVLLGVAPRLVSCASHVYPRAYSDVSYHIDWISQTVDSWNSTPVKIDMQPYTKKL